MSKIWDFIWKDDSFLSWIANVVLAFVLVRFIIYPLLGLVLGIGFPVVAVVSGSMEHNHKGFDSWWQENKVWYESNNISMEEFINLPFKNGFNKGDIMVLSRAKNLRVGDVVVYRIGNGFPIIHRLVKIDPYQTKGDNNALPDMGINKDKIVGKAVFRIPLFGWVKILFNSYIAQPYCSITNNLWPC